MYFGKALEALELGKKVAREGWNGKGMFLWKADGSKHPAEEMRGDWFKPYLESVDDEVMITVNPFICMKASDGSIVIGWLASQTDMLSDDWMIVE